ncbi:hypothetical protein ACVWXQ_007092 [Bradyrhizobium sp. S3.14.4]
MDPIEEVRRPPNIASGCSHSEIGAQAMVGRNWRAPMCRMCTPRYPRLPATQERAAFATPGRIRHALFAGQGTTCPDITIRSRPLSLAA